MKLYLQQVLYCSYCTVLIVLYLLIYTVLTVLNLYPIHSITKIVAKYNIFEFPKVPNMPILSQTLKGHNLETVRPFELKFLEEMYFDQLYLRSTREVLGINQSIAINALSTPALKYHLGLPCSTLLRPVGRPSLKRSYSCFRGAIIFRISKIWDPISSVETRRHQTHHMKKLD
jgi:hypothetical protein